MYKSWRMSRVKIAKAIGMFGITLHDFGRMGIALRDAFFGRVIAVKTIGAEEADFVDTDLFGHRKSLLNERPRRIIWVSPCVVHVYINDHGSDLIYSI